MIDILPSVLEATNVVAIELRDGVRSSLQLKKAVGRPPQTWLDNRVCLNANPWMCCRTLLYVRLLTCQIAQTYLRLVFHAASSCNSTDSRARLVICCHLFALVCQRSRAGRWYRTNSSLLGCTSESSAGFSRFVGLDAAGSAI